MIYTLEYLRKEAEQISGYWNGKDEKFIDHTGELRNDDDAQAAEELTQLLDQVDELIDYLHI